MRNNVIDLENDDTIAIMDYVKVDVLTAGQLMVDDLIVINDEVVSIVTIISLVDGYELEIINDFGERETVTVGEFDNFDLMMLQ
jgi:hypothetical protein